MVNLKEKIKNLPESSGVYIMRDSDYEILYIGKARNLKKRVSQYFSSYGTSTEKIMALMSRVYDFSYIITPSEIDALVLENNLIKKHKPHYNILLKDDKNYPFIKIDLKEEYPRIEIVRKVKDDGAKYFGPYMQGISIKDITELIYSTFPIRSCRYNLSKLPSTHRPCLNYHIGRCLSPCSGKVSIERYNIIIRKVMAFLKGDDKGIAETLNNKMLKASEQEEYELALYYKERIDTLEKIVRKQVTNLPKDYNLDIFGIADNGIISTVNMIIVRGGKMVASENVVLNNANLDESMTLAEYLNQYYSSMPLIADEIITSIKIEGEKTLQEYLSSIIKRKINIITPIKGIRRQLADMADNNAKDKLNHYTIEHNRLKKISEDSLKQLSEHLSLAIIPKRIEAYDISNISGRHKVASMVVFIDGQKNVNHYRRFKIKTVKGADDYASLAEVISRRFDRLDENKDISFASKPDLILIDGGKGQLSVSLNIMKSKGYAIPMIGLAKREEIVITEDKREIILPRNSLALTLLQRIRDEAHRFAITYHRKIRLDNQTKSSILKIPDVGDKRVKLLLEHFKSIDKIKQATIEEIQKINGIGGKTAVKIFNYYHKEDAKD